MTRTKRKVTSTGTVWTFMMGRACSDAAFHAINAAFDDPMRREEQAVMPLAGGIMQHGYQCGLVWGAALAAGAQAHREHGAGPEAETRAILAACKAVDRFRALNEHVDCLDITDIDDTASTMKMVKYFLVKGGSIGCFRRAGRYAPAVLGDIEAALDEKDVEVPSAPVSCAAVLARRMGTSELQATMASGLAGGIGLCGGACGALGAAVWILGMRALDEPGGKIEYKSKRATAALERFMKCADYEFECSTIVGRRFESVADHAAHVKGGGCSEIIAALACE